MLFYNEAEEGFNQNLICTENNFMLYSFAYKAKVFLQALIYMN